MQLYSKMSCWIRDCNTKGGRNASRKTSLFTARTEKMFNNWSDSGIAARGVNEFSKTSRICELHFQADDILKEDIFHAEGDKIVTVRRKIPKLKEDAVPSIFPPERRELTTVLIPFTRRSGKNSGIEERALRASEKDLNPSVQVGDTKTSIIYASSDDKYIARYKDIQDLRTAHKIDVAVQVENRYLPVSPEKAKLKKELRILQQRLKRKNEVLTSLKLLLVQLKKHKGIAIG